MRGLGVHAKALEVIVSLAGANNATGYHNTLSAHNNLMEIWRNDVRR
jgi:hypothetical protein